ncbi:flagellar protein FlaG [Natronincola ferrireducens]|uniref:Flagellar protein FlaG n=1 Tax=Natronincola ferrireducens TaxID=393762 RepID=A0A1G8XMR0_9FIRM|nr:flagellar protein FlaG [Natronincola ferrireducens]SDJ91747.1 flagellar protein FlaG [Natronincola ferrireducens]
MKVDGLSNSKIYTEAPNALGKGSPSIRREATAVEVPRPSAEKQYTEEQIIKAVEKANKSFEPFDRRFEISIHEKTKSIMVKVINSTNDEVIREVPSEKILDMVAHMLEVAGIIIDKKI